MLGIDAKSKSLRQWGFDVFALALLYFLTAKIGLQFAIPPGNASAVWPPSGIALAALVLRSRRAGLGIWIGAFLVSIQTDVSYVTSAAFATGNTLSAILAAWICRKFLNISILFHSSRDALIWLLMSVVSCALAATVGTSCLYFGNYIGWSEVLETWLTWGLGDLTGVMIIAPAVLVVANQTTCPVLDFSRIGELALAFILLGLISQALFGGWLPEPTAQGFLYLPMIVILWMLMRFGPGTVLAGNLLIGLISICGTFRNQGAFASKVELDSLRDLQVFLNVYAVTGLFISGIVQQGKYAESQRQQLNVEVQSNQAQLEVVQEIQRKFFPSTPLQLPECVCAGIWQPAEIASADYFDYLKRSEESVVLIIGDVSGHGVGPALLMTETRAYTRALLARPCPLPALLCQLNDCLHEDTQTGRFVTLGICELNPQTSEFEFVGAGHDALLIRADGSWERLPPSTIPLGLLSELPQCHVGTNRLDPGDLIFLFTDGLIEARSDDGTLYGRTRLIQLLIENRECEIESLLQLVIDDVAFFTGKETPRDDQAAVVLRRL